MIARLFLACVSVLAAFGCSPKNDDSALFEDTGDGWIHFKTTSRDSLGSSFAYVLENSDSSAASFEVELVKKSGYEYGDFGLLYRAQDSTHYYIVSIDIRGSFCVKRRSGDSVVDIVPWTSSPSLVAGYGASNSVKLTPSGAKAFGLYLNGKLERTVDGLSEGAYSGGRNGLFLYVGTAAYETFPAAPVDVYYRIAK